MHISSDYLHIVISPKELVSSDPILEFLKKYSLNYVLSLESGETGHLHLECYAQFPNKKRTDHIKSKIISMYPSIPKNEQKNIRVCVNTIDPDPLYGYGYALKENNVISTTLDPFQCADASDYYEKHVENVESAKKKSFKKMSPNLSINEFADGLLDFIHFYYQDRQYDSSENISWLIDNYRMSVVKTRKFKFSDYQKLNSEKLELYVRDFMGLVLLTAPIPIPVKMHPISENVKPL